MIYQNINGPKFQKINKKLDLEDHCAQLFKINDKSETLEKIDLSIFIYDIKTTELNKYLTDALIDKLKNICQINDNKFYCDLCDFKCSKQSDYDRHKLTLKHTNVTNNVCSVTVNNYTCKICCKEFKSRNGLWNHKKKCIKKEENNQLNLDL